MRSSRGPTFLELARQALSSTVEGYDLLAPRFDESSFRTPAPIVEAMRSQLGEPDSAFDVGCGTGALLEILRPVTRERLVGLDASPGMLALARERVLAVAGPGQLELLQGSILDYTAEREFDVATCFGMFGHIEARDHPKMLERIYASLRPGGRFLCIVSDVSNRKGPLYAGAWLFDNLMKVRNRLVHPPFVMYYLSFLMPRALLLMGAAGFQCEVNGGLFPPPFHTLKLVVARRPRECLPNGNDPATFSSGPLPG